MRDEGLDAAHAEGPGGFHLALGYGQDGPTERLGHVGAVDETDGQHAGQQRG